MQTKTILTAAFALATIVGAPFAFERLENNYAENERKAIFEQAEAYTDATLRLQSTGAISLETVERRMAQFKACSSANETYRSELKSRSSGAKFDRQVMIQTCAPQALQ